MEIMLKQNETKSLLRAITTLFVAAFLFGCAPREARENVWERDVHSFANPSEVRVTHLHLDIEVNFAKKEIGGKATLHVANTAGARKLFLDTRDLTISRVTLGSEEKPTSFVLSDPVKHLGQSLTIDILPATKLVHVYYASSPRASGVQWLEPVQTAGGKKPFVYTQSQAIHARSWVPCQDSPGIRMTYTARVTTRPDLLAVMSAKNPVQKNADGVYEFEMPQPIPSYLLALAVGDLEFRALGERSGVYAEPSVVMKAAWEFADTEKKIVAAEALYGPYRWERYDILVLPPSFPFGGMENPRLTFATPTILTGDRSLTALVAHELAHSWSGNLVTNATWNDFWLNEGFTTYFENRIMEAVYGRDVSEMLAHLSYQDLLKALDEIGHDSADTRLQINLKGRDPDDGFTDIPYDKGMFLLRLLEETVGRERWDAFLREYFDTFAFESMTSQRFLSYLREHLFRGDNTLEERVKIDEWIFNPGLPENCPKPSATQFELVEKELRRWSNGEPAKMLETKGWITQHWLHFLRSLPKTMTTQQLNDLDTGFGLSKSNNPEVLSAWFELAITNRYEPAYSWLEKFLKTVGRRKFLKPLYTKLAETSEGMEMARRIYRTARPMYHSISASTIDAILNWKTEE